MSLCFERKLKIFSTFKRFKTFVEKKKDYNIKTIRNDSLKVNTQVENLKNIQK